MTPEPDGPWWVEPARRMTADLGVRDPEIAGAMCRIPRHLFLPRDLWSMAYQDTPLPIGPEATISAPHMVALQLEWASLTRGLRVLELGSGSGYLAALVGDLVGPEGRVVGVEFEHALVASAREAVARLGLASRVRFAQGDGSRGFPSSAPFDRVIVSYAIHPPFPAAWGEQLSDEGMILAPMVRVDATWLERCRRSGGQ